MNVHLIRHTSVKVPRGICYGQSDVEVKDSFEQEAEVIKEQIKYIHFDKVYCSPLKRCVKLADYCGYADAEQDKRIMEINFGDWELKNFDSIHDPNLQTWYKDYIHVRATNGESFLDQFKRVSNFLDELKQKEYQNVALFTHGGVLIDGQIYAHHFTFKEVNDHMPNYGDVVKIVI